ncbi:MAG: heme A synthase [Acidimicrobiaceae bacterium]|jgi:heme a synthase|nr:heme A synthase [Acidimicrobiaceae bacterium]MBT5581497.1 heme A synthase [Acidimicrobiaceae bacterium]MBT5851651.1 heme A synthase [Acidimicrobiaceae bacterium]
MVDKEISPERYARYTRWALWSLTIIVVSGGSVRLTGSGLGCSDWPNCEEDQFVASLEYHALIEFVNRLFTGVVTVAVILAILGSIRRIPRRPDLVRWSWGLVAGVGAQVVLGAVLVKTDLDPRFTMGHFLLSMVLLWNATVLMHKAADPTPQSAPPRIRQIIWAITITGSVLLVSGTIVTGSGPHSGSDKAEVAERLPFLVRDVARIHAIVAIIVLIMIAALWQLSSRAGLREITRRTKLVAALLIVQGAVGYWQYFTGVPVQLVAVHITLASLTWISIVRLQLTARSLVT